MKPGDIVELKHLEKAKDESTNWSLESGLKLNTRYIVEEVYESGWIILKGKSLGHSGEKFKLVSTTNNTILFYC